MRTNLKTIIVGCLLILFVLLGTVTVEAYWETGTKIGFDSNVDRAIDGEKSDQYLSVYLSFNRQPTGESRIDWNFVTTVEGAVYKNYNDLNYLSVTFAPGVVYIPHRLWSITVSPFLQAKGVKDSDQSALTFGGKVSLRQELLQNFYLGEYYIYKDSTAETDTYSFTEHAVGIYAGLNLTPSLFGEVGYEYSHGDSFRGTGSTIVFSGKGKHHSFSSAFEEYVVRDIVDRNAVGLNLGLDLSKSFSSLVGYTFTSITGELGSSTSHSGFIGICYRF